MFELNGRNALVTGASGGIGAAIARALHVSGAAVALSGTRLPALEALRAELGARAHVVPADLADPAAVEGLVKAAEQAMGTVDILVNNAALNRDMLLMRLTDKDWQDVLNVDLTAAFRLSRAALRGMLKRRWGRIIGIGSVVGTIGNPGQANYGAAKAGLIAMCKAIASEVATRNITANVVSPGFISTAMTEKLNDEQRARILGRIPIERLGEPREVAACVVFLASDEASYVTGQTLHVNGGMAMI